MKNLICRDCGLKKELNEFRRRKKGSEARVHQCRKCHALEERLRSQTKRCETNHYTACKALSALKKAKSARQVEIICSQMIRQFGGINRFCDTWKEQLARDLQRGGLAAMRHIDAVIRILQHCDDQQNKN
ncbi:MAG: hypothetical protein ACR2NI_08840 [Pirellulales bacterium]